MATFNLSAENFIGDVGSQGTALNPIDNTATVLNTILAALYSGISTPTNASGNTTNIPTGDYFDMVLTWNNAFTTTCDIVIPSYTEAAGLNMVISVLNQSITDCTIRIFNESGNATNDVTVKAIAYGS